MMTLLIGGARSGKSSLAVDWGRRHDAAGGRVTFVATAPALDGDMERRIERHRAERPPWPTIEEPHDLVAAIDAVDEGADAGGTLVIIDCLTLWVSNLMLRDDDDDTIVAAATAAASRCARRTGPSVVITNEVGTGIHPESDLGRRYRDLLGSVNQIWAGAAGRCYALIAGKALALHDPPTYAPSAHETSEYQP